MQVDLSLLVLSWCSSYVGGSRINATTEMEIGSVGKSWTCCCKEVDDPETQCSRSGGQLRFYHVGAKKCCKKVDSMFGCTFQSKSNKYSKKPMSPWCEIDSRKYEKAMCCDTGAGAFFVKKTFRTGVLSGLRNGYSSPKVHMNEEWIEGATYHGDLHPASEVIEYLRAPYGADRQMECRSLSRNDEVCEITTKKPDKCCCLKHDQWSGNKCLNVTERPLPNMVKQAGADWEKARDQSYTQCAEHKQFAIMKSVRFQESYQSTCTKRKSRWKSYPTMGGAHRGGRYVYTDESYSCTKQRNKYKKVPGIETRCVRNEKIPYCKGGKLGLSLYLRLVPLGICRDKTTLVPVKSFGRMRCPDDEVPYGTTVDWESTPGMSRGSGTCKCATRCDN